MFREALEQCVRQTECVIALGGSSSQGLCIFHTGVADALYSGQTHPTHPASPEVSGTKKPEINDLHIQKLPISPRSKKDMRNRQAMPFVSLYKDKTEVSAANVSRI